MSWPVIKFSEAISRSGLFSDGDWVESKDQDPEGDVRLIQLADIGVGEFIDKSNRFMTSKRADELRCSYLKAGDILVARMPDPIGRACIFPEDMGRCVTVVDICIVRPDSERIDNRWLMHLINSERFRNQIDRHVTGTTRQRISRGNLAGLEIPLPPLSEQKRIAAILDKADAIRRKRQQAIQLADDFLRAVFLDMFGDPVTNPKGWEERSLASLVVGKFQNGAYYPKEEYSDDGVEMVHMSDAFYDVIQRGNLKRVLANKTDVEKYSLTHEDLMISRRSLNYEGAAKPSMIPNSKEPLIFESSIIRITPDKKKIDLLYLFHYLSNPTVKDHHVRKFVTGATIKGISQKNLEQVTVLVPPLSVQRKFSSIVERQNCTKKMVSESFEKSIETFNSLSQKAFRGEL